MPRLSIDITPEEHQKLKAIAALKGESIKDFVLKRTLGDAPALDDMSEDEAVAKGRFHRNPNIHLCDPPKEIRITHFMDPQVLPTPSKMHMKPARRELQDAGDRIISGSLIQSELPHPKSGR